MASGSPTGELAQDAADSNDATVTAPPNPAIARSRATFLAEW
jgi:hypothetical protein